MDTLDTHGVIMERGYFSVPADTSDESLMKSLKYYGQKFIEEMEKRGRILKSELDFKPDLRPLDNTRKHMLIRGWFTPVEQEREWIIEGLTENEAKAVLNKRGGKARKL